MSKMADNVLDNNLHVNDVDDYNFEKICRLCLSEHGPMLSLRELVRPIIGGRQITPLRRAEIVFYSVCVLIRDKDDLPCQICAKCDNLINNYYDFKKTCTITEHKLNALAKKRRDLPRLHLPQTKGSQNSSMLLVESSMKPAVIPTRGGNETVECLDSPYAENKDSVDPLAIRREDLKHLTTYNNRSKGRVSKNPATHDACLVSTGWETGRDVFNCDIDLHREMLREDCTLTNVFSRQDMLTVDTPKLWDFENRLVPSVSGPGAKEIDQPCEITWPSRDGGSVKQAPMLSPVCNSEVVAPKPKRARQRLMARTRRKSPQKSPPRVLPRYTYSRRCPNVTPEQRETNTSTILDNPSVQGKTRSILFKRLMSIQPPAQERIQPIIIEGSQLTASLPSNEGKTQMIKSKVSPDVQLSASLAHSVPEAVSEVEIPPKRQYVKVGTRTQAPPQPPRSCVECGLTFPSYAALVGHIRSHDANDVVLDLPCPLCDKRFKSEVLLASHTFVRHKDKGDRRRLCHLCGARFDNSRRLDEHLSRHDGKREFICDTCGEGFYNKHGLRGHIERKHLSSGLTSRFVCDRCGVELTTAGGMRRHRLLHVQPPSEKCPLCPRAFSVGAQLRRHLRSHTGETPYVCKVCGRGFTLAWNLTQHSRLHTGLRPYACQVCGLAFTHNVTRRLHVKRQHGGEGGAGRRVGGRVKDPAPTTDSSGQNAVNGIE